MASKKPSLSRNKYARIVVSNVNSIRDDDNGNSGRTELPPFRVPTELFGRSNEMDLVLEKKLLSNLKKYL